MSVDAQSSSSSSSSSAQPGAAPQQAAPPGAPGAPPAFRQLHLSAAPAAPPALAWSHSGSEALDSMAAGVNDDVDEQLVQDGLSSANAQEDMSLTELLQVEEEALLSTNDQRRVSATRHGRTRSRAAVHAPQPHHQIQQQHAHTPAHASFRALPGAKTVVNAAKRAQAAAAGGIAQVAGAGQKALSAAQRGLNFFKQLVAKAARMLAVPINFVAKLFRVFNKSRVLCEQLFAKLASPVLPAAAPVR